MLENNQATRKSSAADDFYADDFYDKLLSTRAGLGIRYYS